MIFTFIHVFYAKQTLRERTSDVLGHRGSAVVAGRQPAAGEIVGLFVVAGNLRGVTDGSQSPAMERSNVVLVAFPDVCGATYTFE